MHSRPPVPQAREVIRRIGTSFRVLSRKGKNLGTYPSREQAEMRLRQVEYFKHRAIHSPTKATRKRTTMARKIDTFKGKPGTGYFVKGKGTKKTLYEFKLKSAKSPKKKRAKKRSK